MRPQLHLFDSSQIDGIIADALATLKGVGVLVENDDAQTLLQEGGVRVDQGRAFFTESLVRQALSTAPSEVLVYDRDGAEALRLGGDAIHFDPGSAALYMLDPETGRRRQGRITDCAQLAWVTEACKYVAAQSTGIVPADMDERLADRFRLYMALLNSRKPVITGTFQKEAFAVMRRLLEAVRGDAQGLRDKPLAIFDCAPTPPLKWSDLTCQALIDCARAGIPAQLVSMPMAGATAPVTLREAVVQHCAENLSGVVIHQLAGAGSPIIYGGSPSALDMRHGTTPMGAIETMMIDVGYAQVGKHLSLPTHAYMALSDTKSADYQAGMETGIGAVLAALAGVNLISGPGMMDYEICQSLEKLVLDNEVCGMSLRLVQGISERSKDKAVELLQAVVSAGHFLADPHTRANFRQEILIPGPVIDRSSYDDWEKRGAPHAYDAARERVKKILAQGNPAPLDEDLKGELTGVMAAEFRRYERALPEL